MQMQIRMLVPLAGIKWVALLALLFGLDRLHASEISWRPSVLSDNPLAAPDDPLSLAGGSHTHEVSLISTTPVEAPVRLVSVLQPSDDLPFITADDQPADSSEGPADSTDGAGARESEGDGEGGDDVDDYAEEPLGEAPEDNSLLFLRRATPLLAPGAFAVDYGIRYTFREVQGFSAVSANGQTVLLPGRARTRRITHPLAIRYGLNRRTQLFASVPAGLAINDRADLLRQEATSVYGLGDVTFGLSYLLRNGNAYCPSVIGGCSVTAPTGADPFENSPGAAALGSGFWSVDANLFLVQQYDPAVVFGGVSFNHQFEANYFGSRLEPGEVISWSLGTGLAVNSDVTFTTIYQGSYQAKLRSDSASIPNSAAEQMSLRFALVLSKCKHRILEPFVAAGLTPDSPHVDVGIVITRQ